MREELEALAIRKNHLHNWQQRAVALPTEILELIFDMACVFSQRSTPWPQHAHKFRDTRNAINLTCFRWRQIALATRALWGRIFVSSRAESKAVCTPSLDLVQIELMRAGNSPLCFHLFCDSDTGKGGKHWDGALSLTGIEVDQCAQSVHYILNPSPSPHVADTGTIA